MLNVYITTAYADNQAPYWLLQNAKDKKYNSVADPETADLILFVEGHPDQDPYFFNVYSNPIFRKFKNKSILYHDADLSITFMKTLSPSIEKWQYNPSFHRPAHYIARLCENDTINQFKNNVEAIPRNFLYSFIGSRNHPSRDAIFNIKHPDDVIITDTTGKKAWELTAKEKSDYEKEYLNSIIESYFVLCPRGFGPSTYRLFEVMQMGRCPVIISDEWVRPMNIDWESFAIFVAEKDISNLPSILLQRKEESKEMGRKARIVWLQHFSPEASFNEILDNAFNLLEAMPGKYWNVSAVFQFFKKGFHFRNLARYIKRKFIP